ATRSVLPGTVRESRGDCREARRRADRGARDDEGGATWIQPAERSTYPAKGAREPERPSQRRGAMKGEAEILRRTGWLRGLLIAYGVGFFSWYFAQTLPVEQPGVLTTIAIGVGIQLAMMLLKASVRRFDKAHGLEGQL